MSELDPPGSYVRLGFLIDQLLPGYVDSYYGPPELRAAVEAGGKPPLDAVEELAERLEESVASDSSLPRDRRQYLTSEVSAMRTTLRILRGEVLDIVDEVRSLYCVTPQWVEESVFEDAHRALEEVLPGGEPLSARVAAFRERSTIPYDVALPIVREFMAELRERTVSRFALPSQEACEIAIVQDKPWVAFNRYLGDARSRIEFNRDVPMRMWDLPDMLAHEAYPGHHTECSLKEERLYRQGGCIEQSIRLSNTPSALVSEGIAMNALESVFSDEDIRSLFERWYAAVGLSTHDAAHARDFAIAMQLLRRVSDNQVLLLYRDGVPEEEVMAYGIRYALTDEALEHQYMRFFKDPLCRSYSYNYTLGCDLVAAFLESSRDRSEAFGKLLCEPLTPSELRRLTGA